jgi:type IV pilus assembly protein PilE
MNVLDIKQIMRKYTNGFTLVELLIAVAVIGILAAIAIPNYQQYILRGNRADAKAILMETAQYMERYYTTNNTYVGATVLSAVSPKGASAASKKYDITFSAGPAANSFTLQAATAGSQDNDACGDLTLSNTGAQTAALATGCW